MDKSQTFSPPPAKLRAIGVLAEARAVTRRELEEKSTLKIFEIGAEIWKDGDGHVAVIQSGRCKLQIMEEAGQAMTLEFLNAGDIIGLVENTAEQRIATVYVATSILSAVITPIAAIRSSLTLDADFRTAFEKQTSSQNIKLRKRLFEMATLPLQSRLASYLIEECEFTQGVSQINHPPTHEELASLLGANREAITRTLRTLEKLGIITYSRQTIKVLSVAQLQSMQSL